jgi:hypothetical protein
MSTRCASCGEEFREGDKIQTLPPILELKRGDKSGELGWYQTPNDQTDIVHIECVQGFYQVENTPEWESIEGNIRERVRQEEIEDIKHELMQELASDHSLVCMECLEPMDGEEVNSMFVELADRFLHEPALYLEYMSYQQAYDLYVRLGQALTRKHSQG